MTKEEWLRKTNIKHLPYTRLWDMNVFTILKVKVHYNQFLIDGFDRYIFSVAFGK